MLIIAPGHYHSTAELYISSLTDDAVITDESRIQAFLIGCQCHCPPRGCVLQIYVGCGAHSQPLLSFSLVGGTDCKL